MAESSLVVESFRVEDEQTGVILNWHTTTPVIHAFDWRASSEKHRDDPSYSAEYTRCGKLVTDYNSGTGRLRELGDWIPMRHAIKVGRPCRVCFDVAEVE